MVDIHYLDPLTHMSCSLETIPYIINKLAHKFTDGKVLMFGGGGYNIWQVVPRAWSHIFLALINKPIQEGPLPEQWIKNGVRTHQ